MIAENIVFQELDGDQAREYVNARQRFDAYLEARKRLTGYKGSMLFARRSGADYLLRDYYDPVSGVRKQKSLGRRTAETEALLADYIRGKARAEVRFDEVRQALRRQTGVNRALALGRVPSIGARIVRAIDDAGLLGRGARIVGTNALFAYEAAAGVRFDSAVTATDDIDLLYDARTRLRFAAESDITERTLLGVLKKVDKTFERTERTFQARNDAGYLVDLISPLRAPVFAQQKLSISNDDADLVAAEIEGLVWQESAPGFESVAIDARGVPVRLVTPDPRAFVVHKFWLSRRQDRNPLKKRRDEAQARAVAALTTRYLPHLPFDGSVLRSFPKALVEAARPLFGTEIVSLDF